MITTAPAAAPQAVSPARAAGLPENIYAGACSDCSQQVPALGGTRHRVNGRWAVRHVGPCPTKPVVGATVPVAKVDQDGIYRADDGTFYKVQIAKQGSGNLYAKKLVVRETGALRTDGTPEYTGSFTYAPGAIHTLRADQRLTSDAAKAFGSLYGICCACGADLTDEVSIATGLGRICRGKYL